MESGEENILEIWAKCLLSLSKTLPASVVNSFFGERSGAVPMSLTADEFIVGYPPNSFIEFLDNYLSYVQEALDEVLGRKVQVVFQEFEEIARPVDPEPPSSQLSQASSCAESVAPKSDKDNREETLSRLNSNFTFQTFVVGENTRFAYTSARDVAEHPGEAKNPLFLHGPSGLGKTHLLQAIARDVVERYPSKVVVYMPSETFGNLYIEAVRQRSTQNTMLEFRKRFRNVDVLLIDDVQFFAGKASMQEEFFHTFNELHDNGKQIVMASDRIPSEMQGLERRLVTRFQSGLTVDITPPDLQTRVAILEEKQHEYKRKLPVAILEYLAQRIKSNVRNLESSMITFQSYLQVSNPTLEDCQEITKALVDKVVGSKFEVDAETQITISKILESVAHHFDVRVQDLKGKSRQSEIAVPRQIAMYLARKLTEKSYPDIATAFEKTHPTVLHSIDVIETKIQKSEGFRQEIADLERKLYDYA